MSPWQRRNNTVKALKCDWPLILCAAPARRLLVHILPFLFFTGTSPPSSSSAAAFQIQQQYRLFVLIGYSGPCIGHSLDLGHDEARPPPVNLRSICSLQKPF